MSEPCKVQRVDYIEITLSPFRALVRDGKVRIETVNSMETYDRKYVAEFIAFAEAIGGAMDDQARVNEIHKAARS